MRKLGIFLSLAFFAIAYSPIAMPAGALVADDVSVPTEDVTTPDADALVGQTVGTVEETLEPAEPLVETLTETVEKVTGEDPGDIVDPPVDNGAGEGDGNDPAPVDDNRETSGNDSGRSTDTSSGPAPATVASASPVAAPQEMPSRAALRSYVAKTPEPVFEPAPTYIQNASNDTLAAGPVEEVKKAASKVTMGILQIIALLMVVGMLSAEFLYGMRRISGGVLRA